MAGDSKLNQARIAAREGLSRARVTQVMNLLRLPQRVQSELQNLPPPLKIHAVSERHLRRLLCIEDDEVQIRDWLELLQKPLLAFEKMRHFMQVFFCKLWVKGGAKLVRNS